jgi:hypothetical protein
MTDRIQAIRDDLENKNIPVISEAEMARHIKRHVVFKPPALPPLPEGFYEATCEDQGRPPEN